MDNFEQVRADVEKLESRVVTSCELDLRELAAAVAELAAATDDMLHRTMRMDRALALTQNVARQIAERQPGKA